jgi:hypothetical protein
MDLETMYNGKFNANDEIIITVDTEANVIDGLQNKATVPAGTYGIVVDSTVGQFADVSINGQITRLLGQDFAEKLTEGLLRDQVAEYQAAKANGDHSRRSEAIIRQIVKLRPAWNSWVPADLLPP